MAGAALPAFSIIARLDGVKTLAKEGCSQIANLAK
jgi:hypothetical protein